MSGWNVLEAIYQKMKPVHLAFAYRSVGFHNKYVSRQKDLWRILINFNKMLYEFYVYIVS